MGVIELLDDDDDDETPVTISTIRDLYRKSGVLAKLRIDPHVQFNHLRVFTIQYPGPAYGLIMVSCNGRVVVKSHHSEPTSSSNTLNPKIGSIIIGVNGYLIPHNAPFEKLLQIMKFFMRTPPVTVVFAEDDDFTSMFIEDFIPNLPVRRITTPMAATATPSVAPSNFQPLRRPPRQKSEVIELLDDDD